MFNNKKVKELEHKISVLNAHIEDLKDFQKELDEKFNRYKRIQKHSEKDGVTINIMPQVMSNSKDYCAWHADLALYINNNEYIFKNFFADKETDLIENLMIDKNYYILERSKDMFEIMLWSNKGFLKYILNIEKNTFMQIDFATFDDCGNSKATRKEMKG